MPREIYTQGYFDGACFLYAIANAYTALTDSVVTQAKWNKLIPNMPFLQDFMYDKGTDGIDKNILIDDNVMVGIMANLLNNISNKFAFSVTKCEKRSVSSKIDNRTVVIFAVKGDTEKQKGLDHWVCGIGTEKSNILIACSYIWHNKLLKNVIETCSKTGRSFNDRVLSGKVIVSNSIYVVSMVD